MEANQPAAANPAITFGLQALHQWRGVADTGRSAASDAGCFEQETTERTEMESVSRFTQLPPVELGVRDESHARLRILFVCFACFVVTFRL